MSSGSGRTESRTIIIDHEGEDDIGGATIDELACVLLELETPASVTTLVETVASASVVELFPRCDVIASLAESCVRQIAGPRTNVFDTIKQIEGVEGTVAVVNPEECSRQAGTKRKPRRYQRRSKMDLRAHNVIDL